MENSNIHVCEIQYRQEEGLKCNKTLFLALAIKFRSFINSKVKFLKDTLIICEALNKNSPHALYLFADVMEKQKEDIQICSYLHQV